MLFNSFTFLVFFAGVLAVIPWAGHRRQNTLLLAASYVFYASWDWRYLGLIVGVTLANYAAAALILRTPRRPLRRGALAAAVTVSLGVLGVFKYADFFATGLAAWLDALGWHADVRLLRLVLPVGISFYTFQALSFTLDVYRGQIRHLPRPDDFALYVAFFPQLVAGPIERAARLLPQIERPRRITRRHLTDGLALMLLGYFQKVVLADNLAIVADRAFSGPAPANGWAAWLGLYAFAIQILCDFGGYSNIARGVARCLGFDLMVNFFSPYCAANPAEFWRRWHISLSTWLRDYLYIPLGGNRGGAWRRARNLAVTMLLGGLWHGAAWTFVWWGAYHGALLVLHRVWTRTTEPTPVPPGGGTTPPGEGMFGGGEPTPAPPLRGRGGFCLRGTRAVLKRLACFHMICLGWVLFRADSFAHALTFYRSLFAAPDWALTPGQLLWTARFTPAVALLLGLEVLAYRRDDPDAFRTLPALARGLLYAACFYAIVLFGAHDAQAFIYFQF
jgi:alginate O-acetyltransferase complex protein AlgI